MATTDITVDNLVINTLTKAQYQTITPSATELYFVTDDAGVTSSDITTALGYTPENQANKVTTISASSTDAQYPSAKCVYNNLDGKQATLVSGTNIKTVNNTSLLGSGNVAVQPTLVSGTNIKTINNTSLLGSGNIEIQAGADVEAYTASEVQTLWSSI
jgi:hypothetical protein